VLTFAKPLTSMTASSLIIPCSTLFAVCLHLLANLSTNLLASCSCTADNSCSVRMFEAHACWVALQAETCLLLRQGTAVQVLLL
jgi:hypothetical protein